MKKSTLLTFLLISAICQFADAFFLGAFTADFFSVGSIVLSILFMVNAKKVFGDEAKSANASCLWTAISAGASVIIGNILTLVIAALTVGIGLLLTEPLDSAINIAFGIWQIIAWNKLRKFVAAEAPVVAA